MPAPSSLACPLPTCAIPPGSGAHFGNKAALGGKIHTGLDLVARIGTRVLAPAPGVVTRWFENGGGGHMMEVEHKGYVTRYAHLSSRLARKGASVNTGDTIARSGASGNVTGPHLHFEVLADGVLVDPEPLLFGGRSSQNVAYPPALITGGEVNLYPRDAGQTCAAGYIPGTANPGLLAGVPGTLWFNRPTNPDGTVNACIQAGLQPGDNAAQADAGEAIGAALGAMIPVLVNGGIVVLVVVLAFTGVRQTLAAAGS